MADSPDHPRRTDPTLRIGGWLPESRHRAAPGRPDAERDPRRHAVPAPARPAPGPAPAHPPQATPGGRRRTLLLSGLAVGVLATLVFALSPFWAGPDRAGPEAVPIEETAAEVVTESPAPDVTFSRAPVSLSTRAALPPRPPTPSRRPSRPATTPTSPPAPPATTTPPVPPVPQPRPDELVPLPPSSEPTLRSSPGGPETFIDFVNARGSEITVYWLDYGGQRQRYAIVPPGGSHRQQTYVGHPWVVTDAAGAALVCFQPTPELKKAVVR